MPNQSATVQLNFTHAERWVVHSLLLDHLGYGRVTRSSTVDPYVCELAILEKLESDISTFTPTEIDRLRSRCLEYSNHADTHAHDRAVAERVLDRITATLDDPVQARRR